jgi:hypothetical protein
MLVKLEAWEDLAGISVPGAKKDFLYTHTKKKKEERRKKIFKKPKKTKTSFYLVDYHPSCQRSQLVVRFSIFMTDTPN